MFNSLSVSRRLPGRLLIGLLMLGVLATSALPAEGYVLSTLGPKSNPVGSYAVEVGICISSDYDNGQTAWTVYGSGHPKQDRDRDAAVTWNAMGGEFHFAFYNSCFGTRHVELHMADISGDPRAQTGPPLPFISSCTGNEPGGYTQCWTELNLTLDKSHAWYWGTATSFHNWLQ